MERNNATVSRATLKDRKEERKIEKKEVVRFDGLLVRRNFRDALPNLHPREYYDIFLVLPYSPIKKREVNWGRNASRNCFWDCY